MYPVIVRLSFPVSPENVKSLLHPEDARYIFHILGMPSELFYILKMPGGVISPTSSGCQVLSPTS
jgi:hypothetical protein